MAICKFCLGSIPLDRYDKWHKKIKYCSKKCIKRSYNSKKVKYSTVINGSNLKSNTGKGLFFEEYAQSLIGGALISKITMNQKFDILLPNGKRVDVKSSNLYKRKSKRNKLINQKKQSGCWTFIKNKKNCSEYYFCIGLINDKPVKHWLIPSEVFKNGKCIGYHSSSFDEYLFRIA